MRLAYIRDGVVVNVVEAEPDFRPEEGILAIPSTDAGPGWIYDGKAFARPKDSAPPPEAVSMFQIREAMRRSVMPEGGTLLDAVNTFVDAQRAEQPMLALAWEYAVQIEREGALLQSLAEGLAMDAPQIDDLFRLAASINS